MTHSFLELFNQAGLIGKSVIISLIFASIWCWAIIISTSFRLSKLNYALKGRKNAYASRFSKMISLGKKESEIRFDEEPYDMRLFRVSSRLKREAQDLMDYAQSGLSSLAIIASVSPFVGLFGTVWGIMTSFQGIAASKDTSLAVVAPGIAEALLATAIGLAAAIPASIAYNKLKSTHSLLSKRTMRKMEEQAFILMKKEA
jgi:biopolymer transport protein ExbB/TolQ